MISGSDKRFGVGFRLGRNADFQVVVELGPQSETAPLVELSNRLSKRGHVLTDIRETLYTDQHVDYDTQQGQHLNSGSSVLTKLLKNKKHAVEKSKTESFATKIVSEEAKQESTTEESSTDAFLKENLKDVIGEIVVENSGESGSTNQSSTEKHEKPLRQKKQESFYDFYNSFVKWLTSFTLTNTDKPVINNTFR